ncbi:hypothetical protein [Mycolicibacterium hippocampi]|uniref:Transmembrane protein n=1 Tax=Mycolicibacterium hippocampi TaxID=659824 RepID=A0A7I9ZH91_9MYCO|nr:hypothetical protein [Mycolicibacterium hippocampi]GFH00229.1 hypothetical protein MHIP_07120 [Mycolicibacterium hippocampi]
MSAISTAFRGLTKVADATTATAGAVGGAAINGVAGGVRGAANGVRTGLSSGSRSPAAAALTIGAIGAAGLVEWPLLVTVGGAALVVHRLSQRAGEADAAPAVTTATRQSVAPPVKKVAPAKKAPAKKAPAKKAPAKKASAKKASSKNPSARPARKAGSPRRTAGK